MASSGCGSGVKVWIASLAAASDCGSSRLATSSRLRRGVGVALRRRQAEPFEGFGEVLFDADAAGIEDAEVELAVGDAAIGRLAEPLRRRSCSWRPCRRRRRRARRDCASPWRCRARRPAVVAPRDIDVLLHAQALFVEGAEPEDRRHHAGLRRAVVPFRGFVVIRRARPCLRRSARRSRRRRSDRPSARRRAAPARRCASGSFSVGGTCTMTELAAGGRRLRGRNRAGHIAWMRHGCGGRRRGLRDRDRGGGIGAGRRGVIERLPADRRRRGHRGRCGIRHRRLGAVSRGRLGRGWRLARILHGRHRRRAAAVEQRHRHLEGAEHDHDHARADQQRADLGGDRRRSLALSPARRCLGRAARRPCRSAGGAAAAACAARRAAAMKLDVLTGSRGWPPEFR